ncbi:MAG: hypothetical protein ACJ780_10860 [Solirubrobacteraceae bacterium]
MGETVDALGYKADVPARAKDSVTDKVQGVTDKVQGVRTKITGAGSQVSEATPSTADVKQAGRKAFGIAQENPFGLVIGAAAVGFLAGLMIPSTEAEDARLGVVSDQVKEQAKQTGQEAVEHAKQVAQDAAQTAGDKAQEAAEEVKGTAQQHAEELKSSAAASVKTDGSSASASNETGNQ